MFTGPLFVCGSRIHRIKIRFVKQYAHHTPSTRGYNSVQKTFIPQNASSRFYAVVAAASDADAAAAAACTRYVLEIVYMQCVFQNSKNSSQI